MQYFPMPFQIFSLILFKWIINGRIVFMWAVNGLGHTPGAMKKSIHFYIIKYYYRGYTMENISNIFDLKQTFVCDNFGCHLQH